MTPRRISPGALGLLVALTGCALRSTWMHPDAAPVSLGPDDTIESTLLLVGDAGSPALDAPEPVLEALRHEAALDSARTVVVFLGDNVYPDGLPGAEAQDRGRAETILRLQADAIRRSGARGIFLPGNHDYHLGGRAGVRREAEYIAALGAPKLEWRPLGGCAGPEAVDVGTRLRLVLFDSNWWLRDEFAAPPDPACAVQSEATFLAGLEAALSAAGERLVVLAAHHPVASNGWHGGFFTWRDHLFPLSRARSWLWLPLPVVGSLYPFYRMAGGYGEDILASRYQRMLDQLEPAFRKHPPLAWAAGHEHSLQVLSGRRGVQYVLVSGAGSMTRPDPVARDEDTLCASPHAGFLRLDVLRDGRARIEVVEVLGAGQVHRPWAAWIVPLAAPAP